MIFEILNTYNSNLQDIHSKNKKSEFIPNPSLNKKFCSCLCYWLFTSLKQINSFPFFPQIELSSIKFTKDFFSKTFRLQIRILTGDIILQKLLWRMKLRIVNILNSMEYINSNHSRDFFSVVSKCYSPGDTKERNKEQLEAEMPQVAEKIFILQLAVRFSYPAPYWFFLPFSSSCLRLCSS